MAGDKFNLFVKSWWNSGNSPGPPVSPLNDLLAAMAGNIGSLGGNHATAAEITNSGVLSPNVTSFLNSQGDYNTSKPKAFINWVLFDEQFKYAAGSSGFEQVGNSNTLTEHTRSNLSLDKSGYLYIYVSNETPNIDVFFDNLQVTHIRGPLLEETHYYPFGLAMAGISSKALSFGDPSNKEKTFQSQRFDDDLALNWIQFKWRNHDGQIGRFVEIDPLSDKYVYNSTYAFSENHVTSHIELEGLEKLDINDPNTITYGPIRGGTTVERKVLENKSDDKKASKGNKDAGGKTTAKKDPPLFGETTTHVVKQEMDIYNSGMGDKLTISRYTGQVAGEKGTLSTTDVTYSNGNVDGASVTLLGTATVGVNKEGEVKGQIGILGAEGHVGVSVLNGSLFSVKIGGSYTNSEGQKTGGDVKVSIGGATVAALVVGLATGGWGLFAF